MAVATAEAPTGRKSRTKKAPATAAASKPKRVVSDDHKKQMATGRTEASAVRRYLEALAVNKPKRGRKVTPDTLRARLAKVDAELGTDLNSLQRLLLNQEKKDIGETLASMEEGTTVDLSELEAEFVKVGGAFAKRKGISRSVFRDAGVKPEVLKKAGI